jgi:type I restriction enzyme S subunit
VSRFAALEVGVPPLGEQRRIAAILSSIDDAIEATQAVIDQLQIVTKAMMAEVSETHTWPMRTVGALIAEHGGEVRTGPFGTVLRADEQDPSGTPLISVREIRDGFVEVVDDTPRIPARVVQRLPHFVLSEGDVVFARKRAVDRCAVIGPREAGWMMGSDCIRVRLPTCLNPIFAGYWFRTERVRNHILACSVGSTTMVTLRQGTLESISVPVPPQDLQQEIAGRLGSIEFAADANAVTLRQLRQVKVAFMSVLLTGEVRVKPDEEAA